MELPENIILLIEKYQAGTISAQELSELNYWYHDHDDSLAQIVPESKPTLTSLEIELRLQQKLTDYIRDEENTGSITTQATPVRSIWRRHYGVAAAILLIGISFGGYFLLKGHKTTTRSIVQTVPSNKIENIDIAAGGNKAILTLADGTRLLLDSAGNGRLGTQGTTSVQKLSDGQVTYLAQGGGINIADAPIQYNTISTPRGGQYRITLSDGTKVWLDAASSLHYPVTFTGASREVLLYGEAYFEVAKNAAKPFIVQAGNSKIEVLGTHFNVNAYPDEARVKTTLLEGKVKVNDINHPTVSKYLSPGEQSAIDPNGNIKITKADLEQAIAWKNGYFQFSSTNLKNILRQISRWYDADIVYKSVQNPVFTGQLNKNLPVSKVFAMLSLTNEIHYKIEGRKIIVTTK